MEKQRNASNVWPYVIAGSAIGGAVGYLLLTESGRKVRHAVTHPDEMADTIENARGFIESQAKAVTGQVRSVIDKAKSGLDEGQRAYREAEQGYRSQLQQLEGKNNEITSTVHKTVDNVSRTAYTVEESVLDPIFELGALYRGFERGIRAVFGNKTAEPGQVSSFHRSERFSG
jgi:gas vesicle protein